MKGCKTKIGRDQNRDQAGQSTDISNQSDQHDPADWADPEQDSPPAHVGKSGKTELGDGTGQAP